MAKYSFDELKKKYEDFQEPLSIVKVDDKKISDDKNSFIIGDVSVDITCGYEASIASFCIYNCYDTIRKCFLMDELKKYIAMGLPVTIFLGYATKAVHVFTGFISRVNYIYSKKGQPHVQVSCMDAKGIMMANNQCRQLLSTSYSAAVEEIFEKPLYAMLKGKEIIKNVSITETSDRRSSAAGGNTDISVEMDNESDYEFVVRAAKRFNYEFYIDCGNVIFRKAKPSDSEIIELSGDDGIRSMDIQYDCTGIAGKITVRGTDIDKGVVIEATLKNNNNLSIGSIAKSYVKNNTKVYVDSSIRSQSDADNRAAYYMEDVSYRLGSLECECTGIPDIKPGYFIRIKDMGKGIDNSFYVVSVVHTLNQDEGFVTRITGKTNKIV